MKKVILLIFLFNIITACSKDNFVTYHFFSLGTIIDITIQEKYAKDLNDINKYINNLSEIIVNDEKNINNASINEKINISKETLEIYKRSIFYYNINKKYDPTSYTVSSLYGFSEGLYHIPSTKEIINAKNNAGFNNIILNDNYFIKKSPALIDFSANAKGYIIDKTVLFMKNKGINNFIINAGGDLYISGKKHKEYFKTGIIDPNNKTKPLSIINIENMAVATSGNYERYFIEKDKYINHIFSGITFEPVNNYKSVSVISEMAEKSDGFATLFYLLDIDDITNYCKKFNIAVLILTKNNKIIKLCNWEKYEKL